jgi:hypothetical protein
MKNDHGIGFRYNFGPSQKLATIDVTCAMLKSERCMEKINHGAMSHVFAGLDNVEKTLANSWVLVSDACPCACDGH